MHAWDEGHRVDWEGTKILESEPHYLKGKVLEALDQEDLEKLKSGPSPPDLAPIFLGMNT